MQSGPTCQLECFVDASAMYVQNTECRESANGIRFSGVMTDVCERPRRATVTLTHCEPELHFFRG